jgi:ferritin-like metal-binding protein YciE
MRSAEPIIGEKRWAMTNDPFNPETAMETLTDLFEDMLKDVYYAEKAILKALPKMEKSATAEDLKSAFAKHRTETEGQVQRLEAVFGILGKKPQTKKCPATDGLLQEGEDIMTEAKDPAVRDAGLVAAAQAVEHYEIARYTALSRWAETLGMDDAVELLNETLEQEEATDEALAELSEAIDGEASGTEDGEEIAESEDQDDDAAKQTPAKSRRARA